MPIIYYCFSGYASTTKNKNHFLYHGWSFDHKSLNMNLHYNMQRKSYTITKKNVKNKK